jgi:signal peptidase I
MRKVGAVRAFFGNLCAGGLGYLYVGRPHFAFISFFFIYIDSALVGWSGLAHRPVGFYVAGFINLGFGLFFPIHAAVLAVKNNHTSAKRYNHWWIYCIWLAAWLGMVSLFLHYRDQLFGFESFRIPSSSNSHTIESGEFIMADTWRYKSHAPEFGELIVYSVVPGTKYLKRLVGLPGDTIELRDGVLIRNGQAVNEPYLHEPNDEHSFGRNIKPITLATGEYYMLGDFRDNSHDSRSLGPVNKGQLHGRVEYIWFSHFDGAIHWDRFGKSLLAAK